MIHQRRFIGVNVRGKWYVFVHGALLLQRRMCLNRDRAVISSLFVFVCGASGSPQKPKLVWLGSYGPGRSILFQPFRILHHLGDLRGQLSLLDAHIPQLPVLLLLADILNHAKYGASLHNPSDFPADADCLHQLLHASQATLVVPVVLLHYVTAEVLLDHGGAVVGEQQNHLVGSVRVILQLLEAAAHHCLS